MNKSQNRIFSTLMFALIDEVVGIISNKTNQYNYTKTENLNWVTTYWQTGIQEIEAAKKLLCARELDQEQYRGGKSTTTNYFKYFSLDMVKTVIFYYIGKVIGKVSDI